jgi:hypothetical protein
MSHVLIFQTNVVFMMCFLYPFHLKCCYIGDSHSGTSVLQWQPEEFNEKGIRRSVINFISSVWIVRMDKTSTSNFPYQEANYYLTPLRSAITIVTELPCSSSNSYDNVMLIGPEYIWKLFVCIYVRLINHSVTLGFLSFDYCLRQTDFKYVVVLNAFTTVRCTEARGIWRL